MVSIKVIERVNQLPDEMRGPNPHKNEAGSGTMATTVWPHSASEDLHHIATG